jgi:hypothetical protein
VLAQHAAGAPLGYADRLAQVLDRQTSACGAQ